jgi:hypothetical protein
MSMNTAWLPSPIALTTSPRISCASQRSGAPTTSRKSSAIRSRTPTLPWIPLTQSVKIFGNADSLMKVPAVCDAQTANQRHDRSAVPVTSTMARSRRWYDQVIQVFRWTASVMRPMAAIVASDGKPVSGMSALMRQFLLC